MSEEKTSHLKPVYELPHQAIDRWATLSAGELLAIPITKEVMDDLMLSLRRSAIAQMSLGNAFAAHSNGDREKANENFLVYQANARDCYSGVNRFIEAVMTKAMPANETVNG